MQPTSRITSKGQTTLPRELRQKLSWRPGDILVYELHDDEVRVRKQIPLDVGYLRAVQATLCEWIPQRMRQPSTLFEQFEIAVVPLALADTFCRAARPTSQGARNRLQSAGLRRW